MTIPEFVNRQTADGMSKTAAVNLAVAITGISPRSAWRMVDSERPTPKTVDRLLDVFTASDISQKTKNRLFPEVFFLDESQKIRKNSLVKKNGLFFLVS